MPILGIDASRAVKKEKTGVEWYSFFLLNAMKRCVPKGWKVRCYVPSPSTPHPNPLPQGEREMQDNSPPLMGGVRGGWQNEGNWQWRKLGWPFERGWAQGRLSLELLAHPPEALFVPSRILPFMHPPRTVTTVHDVVFLTHPELYEPHDLWLQKRGLEFAIRFARRIIVPSQAVREEVIRAGAGREQVVVVRHGVEIEPNYESNANITNYESDIRNIRTNSPFGSYILFIGRLERKKNVLGLIHAFRYLLRKFEPNYESNANITNYESDIRNIRTNSPFGSINLVLAGPLGYGSEDVLQAIKTFKLEDRVVHLGYVERASFRSLLQSAALLVLPSFGEGFGLPVLEAMAQGTPVVCSDIPVLHEVGGNAVQYVNPHDPEDIARGLRTVLESSMLQSEMIKRGKEIAQNYTWEKSATATWDTIESL